MGENFFFVAVVMAPAVQQFPNPYKVALGVVFIAGVIFLILSALRVREAIIDAVSPCLRSGIAAGIGVFIAFIGLKTAGVIVGDQINLVQLNPYLTQEKAVWVFLGALMLTAALISLRVPGAIVLGILAATVVTYGSGITPLKWEGFVSLPKKHAFFHCDLKSVISMWHVLWPYVVVFLFMDMFDTVGTLIGVSEQAGFMRDGKLPRANRALMSDAIGTVAGAAMGTSTVTSYIESAAGVQQGGRTGLTSVVTALLFLLALVFAPVVQLVGSCAVVQYQCTVAGYNGPTLLHFPVLAPALVIVGAMMMANVTKIDWQDYTEAIPSFLIIIGIPLTFSIADGLALGLIAYPLIKILTGRVKGTSWLSYVVGAAFLARYIFLTV